MHPLYSTAQIRSAEYAAAAQLPPGSLMQRAGQAAADAALALLAEDTGPVLVLAGPGNNGGDALEAAARLCEAGVQVALIHLPGGTRSAEGAQALARAQASAARFIDRLDAAPEWVLAVDGLFGIGLGRPLEGAARELALAISAAGRPVLALDVPSGLDADTGAVVGPDGVAVRATHTLTFIGDKPGLHTGAGRDHAGTVTVAALEIDPSLIPGAEAQLGEVALLTSHLRRRAHDSHKGSFGDVTIIGGADGMAGAPVLAARAALYSGSGRVFVAWLGAHPPYDSQQPELMFRDAATFDAKRGTLVLGPGMGDSAVSMRVLAKALDGSAPLVLDADALNLVAASPDLQHRLATRDAPAVLTPHPLEAARLLGVTAGVIQEDRLAAARELAERLASVIVLKGSGSVIARPGGAVVINPTGNPALATGGTGDVLAGLCGSLLAQGWPAWEAAIGSVWLHGAAADHFVDQMRGPIGFTASELPLTVRQQLNHIVYSE